MRFTTHLLKECPVIKAYNKALCVFLNVGPALNRPLSRYPSTLSIGRPTITRLNSLVIARERNTYVDSKNTEENEEFRSMTYISTYSNISSNDK